MTKMKVTTKPLAKNGKRTYLWAVLIDGQPIKPKNGTSRGRVLKMGTRYLPVLEGGSILANFGPCNSRLNAAEWVAQCAKEEGFIS